MSKGWCYTPGEWYVTCDVCGKKMKSSKARHRWDGFIVCDADFEHRHPQDFIRPIKENISVPWTRPRGDEIFINACSIAGQNGVAGVGTAGCAIAGQDNGYRENPFPSTFNMSTL
jgi:hypothetical protein